MVKTQEISLDDALNIAIGHMQQSNYRVAAMVLNDILSAEPENEDSLFLLSLAHYYMGDLNNALEAIEKGLDVSTKDGGSANQDIGEWHCNHGIMLHELERHEDALKAYDKAIKTSPDFSNSYWNKAHTLWTLERYEEAERISKVGIDINPNQFEAWLNYGTSLVKLGNTEEAIKAWERACDIDPEVPSAWNNMGNAYRELGNLVQAKECCLKAVELDPDFPEALNNMGGACVDEEEYEQAEQYYRRAIALRPDYYQAHNNLCIVLISQNRFEEAIQSARVALSYKKDYEEALLNVCIAHRSLGQIPEAQKAIESASHLSPDNAEIRIELADILFMQDRLGDAEIELENAKKLAPDSPKVLIKLADVLERGGKLDDALETINQAIELRPELPDPYVRKAGIYHISNMIEEAKECLNKALEIKPDSKNALLCLSELHLTTGDLKESEDCLNSVKEQSADIPNIYFLLSKLKKFTKDDADFQKMLELEKTIESKGLEHASFLNFALFTAYEHIKDYPKAFHHLKRGNEFKRKIIPYDHEQQTENYKTNKERFNKKILKGFEGKGYESDLPVFIVGMPRSGTTLTEQIISSHPDVFGAGELMEISHTGTEFGPLTLDNASKQGEWYVERVKERDPSGSAKRITDKMPGNYNNLGKIISILPHAKIIHCRRNPIDTCLSCYKQNFARGQYWSYDLTELGQHYNMYLDLMSYWRELLGDRFIEIDYEETVTDLEGQARKLIDHIELPWDEACLEPHKQKRAVLTASKTQVIKPVYKSSVKAWERYEDELKPLIDALKDGPAKDLLDL